MLLGQDIQGEQIDLLATVSITGVDGDGDPQAVNVNLQVQDDKPFCITGRGHHCCGRRKTYLTA